MENQDQYAPLLDTTMVTLTTDIAELTPQSGKGVIDQWISLLGQSEQANEVTELLQLLKTQLVGGGTNPGAIRELLLDLANHAEATMTGPDIGNDVQLRLTALTSALQTVAAKLGNV